MSKNTCFTNENTRLTTNPPSSSPLSLPLLSPCVRPKRLRVCRHHAHVCFNMCAGCRHTRGRFEWTHGGVSESTYGFFLVFFSACQSTHTQTKHTARPPTSPRPQRHTPQQHDHNTTRRQTETDRYRQRHRKKTEKEREEKTKEKEREEKMKEKMKEKMRHDKD